MQNLLLILRLIWSPKSLAQVAIRTSNVLAVVFGAAALALNWALIFIPSFIAVSEPYLKFWLYLLECANRVFLGAPFIFLISTPLIILFVVILNEVYSKRLAAGCRTIALAPTCFILPVFIWSVAIMLVHAQHNDVAITKTVPQWVFSPIFRFLGSPWWLLIMLLGGIVLCIGAVLKVKRTFPRPDSPNCVECGYFLKGLPERRCPECGKEF